MMNKKFIENLKGSPISTFRECSHDSTNNRYLVSSRVAAYNGDSILRELMQPLFKGGQQLCTCDAINYDDDLILFTEFKCSNQNYTNLVRKFKEKFSQSLQILIMNRYFEEISTMELVGILVVPEDISVRGSSYQKRQMDESRQRMLLNEVNEAKSQGGFKKVKDLVNFLNDSPTNCCLTEIQEKQNVKMFIMNSMVFDGIADLFVKCKLCPTFD